MTANRDEIVRTIEEWLQPGAFKDYNPNGLQTEGTPDVRKIVTGVTASQDLLDAAMAEGADLILVHHGYFWKGEDQRIQGMKRQRLKTLLSHDINLLAYHLPLDAHQTLGNNAQLAHVLGIENARPLTPESLVWTGQLARAMTAGEFADHLNDRLNREALHVGRGPETIRTICWCTGAAQGFINEALEAGADAYLSGEISEPTTHTARECGIHYFAAGHHATERYGVKALGDRIADRFGVEHRFIDIDNPV